MGILSPKHFINEPDYRTGKAFSLSYNKPVENLHAKLELLFVITGGCWWFLTFV